jgi:cell division protease FtsH
VPIDDKVKASLIARGTPGFSGADLANAMNEAALLAAREGKDEIIQHHLEEAVEKVLAGPERKSRRLLEKGRKRVAYHETGHALVAYFCPNADPVAKITIIPRGKAALGYTLQLPEEEQFLLTKSAILDKICVSMGGRVAEEIILGEVSSGAQNDLEVATEMARGMVTRFGMSEDIGPMALSRETTPYLRTPWGQEQANVSPELSSHIDKEIKKILSAQDERARNILTKNKKILERVAEKLLQVEVLNAEEFEEIIKNEQ